MKMMFAMIFAMLLLTASARMLKSNDPHSCDEDYQAPNYWGECINGEFRNVDRIWNRSDRRNVYADCGFLVILVPQDSVGDKTLGFTILVNKGGVAGNSSGSPLTFNDFGYYSVILSQSDLRGPDVDIIFFLDGTKVHEGNYQQNYCHWEAGAITTNDPNARTYEGSWHFDMPGHIITSF